MPDSDGLIDLAGELLIDLMVGAVGLVADQGVDTIREKRMQNSDANRRTAQELQILCGAMWKILQRDYGYDAQKLKDRVAQIDDIPQRFRQLCNKYILQAPAKKIAK